jgi:hypothetical protein
MASLPAASVPEVPWTRVARMEVRIGLGSGLGSRSVSGLWSVRIRGKGKDKVWFKVLLKIRVMNGDKAGVGSGSASWSESGLLSRSV